MNETKEELFGWNKKQRRALWVENETKEELLIENGKKSWKCKLNKILNKNMQEPHIEKE